MKQFHFLSLAATLALVVPQEALSAPQMIFYTAHDGAATVVTDPSRFGPPPGAQVFQAGGGSRAITWNVTYQDVIDGSGFGFDDATEGATRRSTAVAVLNYINTIIDHTATIDVHFAASTNLPASNTLASCGTFYFNSPSSFQGGTAFEHITTGSDVDVSNPDFNCTVNFGKTWNSDLGAPGGGEFDLFTVLLHEMTHALGVASLTVQNGASAFGSDIRSTFDDLLETGDTVPVKLWNSSTGAYQGTAGSPSAELVDTTDGIFFTGTDANTILGAAPDIYVPGTFASGSSISHWNTNSGNGTVAAAVMVHAVAAGVSKRTYQNFERAALSDLGYTVPTLPVEIDYFLVD